MRPLARSYLQHGSRHGVHGSDPIPDIGQIRFATMRTNSAFTITADNNPHYPYGSDGTIVHFETSDDTVFTAAATSAISGTTWGIKCLENGTYIIRENYRIHGGTAAVIGLGYHSIVGGNTISFYQAGRTGASLQDGWDKGQASTITHISFEEWTDATDGNPAPIYVVPYLQIASGTNPTVDVETMVIYLGPYAGGNI